MKSDVSYILGVAVGSLVLASVHGEWLYALCIIGGSIIGIVLGSLFARNLS